MAVKETCAVLFILSLMVFPSYISCNDLCTANDAFNSSNNFTITVSPETLAANTLYTVTVNGSGNVILNLRAKSGNSSVGNWTEGNTCDGGPLFMDPFNNTVGSKVAEWNSTDSLAPVEIGAYINSSGELIKVFRVLNAATTIAPDTTANTNSTAAPTGNTTEAPTGNTTEAPVTNTTQASTVSKTTSSGSVVRPSSMLMALIQAFGFLVISIKLLS